VADSANESFLSGDYLLEIGRGSWENGVLSSSFNFSVLGLLSHDRIAFDLGSLWFWVDVFLFPLFPGSGFGVRRRSEGNGHGSDNRRA